MVSCLIGSMYSCEGVSEVIISWASLQGCAPCAFCGLFCFVCEVVGGVSVCSLLGVVGKKRGKKKNANRPSMLRHEGVRVACIHPRWLPGQV